MQNDLERIRNMREFNRFYTGILGLLDQHILRSVYSLAEARILYELYTLGTCTANTLTEKLHVDKSYLSRMLQRFQKDGLLTKQSSRGDKRAFLLCLTQRGQAEAERLMEESDRQIDSILAPLNPAEQDEVLSAMSLIKRRLTQSAVSISIRPFRAAGQDAEYMIVRHLRFYELEYGLTSDVWKTYVTDAVNQLVSSLPSGESCAYILEANGVPSGCIAVAHAGEGVAQLRFFLIEPELRGAGCGNRLMEAALDFCREKQYKKVFLWTFSKLDAARHLYAKYGFQITETHENVDWGAPVLEERWEAMLL